MNTLRNLTALALFGCAAFSPAHAEQSVRDANTRVTHEAGDTGDVLDLLQGTPEVPAPGRREKDKVITEALKDQFDTAGGKQAVANALTIYLSRHMPKERQGALELARDGREKVLAETLKANFGERP